MSKYKISVRECNTYYGRYPLLRSSQKDQNVELPLSNYFVYWNIFLHMTANNRLNHKMRRYRIDTASYGRLHIQSPGKRILSRALTPITRGQWGQWDI